MFYSLIRGFAIILLRLLFRIEVKGKYAIPKEGPFILTSSHHSNLDPIILGSFSRRRLYYLAKEELFRNVLAAKFLRGLRCIPLKRSRASVFALKKAIEVLKKGQALVIFPQGRRSEKVTELKRGIEFLYRKTSAPIICAKIENSGRALPPGRIVPRLYKLRVKFKKINIGENERNKITEKIAQAFKESW